MKNLAIGLFVSASLLLAGCATQLSPQIYKGSYFYNFESSSFTPAGSDEAWCVNSADMAKAQLPSAQSGTADVVVQGSLSAKGHYCNLGASKHVLKVYKVLSVANLRPGD
jgi:uncharacterized protein YceK